MDQETGWHFVCWLQTNRLDWKSKSCLKWGMKHNCASKHSLKWLFFNDLEQIFFYLINTWKAVFQNSLNIAKKINPFWPRRLKFLPYISTPVWTLCEILISGRTGVNKFKKYICFGEINIKHMLRLYWYFWQLFLLVYRAKKHVQM